MEKSLIDKTKSIEENKKRLERLRSMQIGSKGSQSEISNPRVIVAQAVKREFPDLPYDEVQKTTRELVLAPRRASVKVGNSDVPVADLQFRIAESIELINSETNSAQEYFSWFRESAEIMQHMNDGYVSDEDLRERNEWVADSYTREAEIQTCLALYQSSSFPEARKKYDILYNKLAKLRQIRTAIKECTGKNSDEKLEKIDKDQKLREYERAKVYLAAMREFMKHDANWNMPKSTLRRLRIYRGDDVDLSGEYDTFYGAFEPDYIPETEFDYEPYSFDDDLREFVLFHWDDEASYAPVNSYAEEFLNNGYSNSAPATEEDIIQRIAALSGRRPSPQAADFVIREKRPRSFDPNRFMALNASVSKENRGV